MVVAAGFDNERDDWNFQERLELISFQIVGEYLLPSFNSITGMDVLSLILSVLVTPHSLDDDYPE